MKRYTAVSYTHLDVYKRQALESAMVLRLIDILREEPNISQEVLGEKLGTTRRVVQKQINALKESGRIVRVGGKRYGHWQIND